MLLPSALSCPRPAGRPRLQASLFTSPPASPPSSQNGPTTLFQACLSLQSLLQSPQPHSQLQPSPFFNENVMPSQQPPQQRRQLPTPPMRNASLSSPMKLRLRSHKGVTSSNEESNSGSQIPRKRVVKRSPPPRGANKRRREDDQEMSNKKEHEVEMESNYSEDKGPSTPKRMRVAPETMPLGLERRDFEMLHDCHQYTSDTNALGFCLPKPRNLEEEMDNGRNTSIDWSSEEDRQLVELILGKMRLNKSDWQDCSRTLGRGSGNIKARWNSLLGGGEVGLKTRARGERRTNSATWR